MPSGVKHAEYNNMTVEEVQKIERDLEQGFKRANIFLDPSALEAAKKKFVHQIAAEKEENQINHTIQIAKQFFPQLPEDLIQETIKTTYNPSYAAEKEKQKADAYNAEAKQVAQAVAKRDISALKKLLGKNYLEQAAQKGFVAAFELLWPAKGTREELDRGEYLHEAAKNGRLAMVDWLIKKGANINYANEFGETPLICTCLGKEAVAERLLSEPGINVNYLNKNYNSVLHYAIAAGQGNLAKKLLRTGKFNPQVINLLWKTIDIKGQKVELPLLYKIIVADNNDTPSMDLELVKLMVEAGANIDAKGPLSEEGGDLDGIATKHNKIDISVYIANEREKRADEKLKQQVEQLVKDKDIEELRKILDQDGWHYLVEAARKGFVEALQLLLKYEEIANKNVQLKECLLEACIHGHIAVVNWLLSHLNVSVNIQDKDGETPLHLACARGHVEIIERLLKCNDINLNLIAGQNDSVLLSAPRSRQGNAGKIIKLLLDSGKIHQETLNRPIANRIVNVPPCSLLKEIINSRRPEVSNLEIIKLLIKHGARPLVGEDLVKFANEKGKLEIAHFLLERQQEAWQCEQSFSSMQQTRQAILTASTSTNQQWQQFRSAPVSIASPVISVAPQVSPTHS